MTACCCRFYASVLYACVFYQQLTVALIGLRKDAENCFLLFMYYHDSLQLPRCSPDQEKVLSIQEGFARKVSCVPSLYLEVNRNVLDRKCYFCVTAKSLDSLIFPAFCYESV